MEVPNLDLKYGSLGEILLKEGLYHPKEGDSKTPFASKISIIPLGSSYTVRCPENKGSFREMTLRESFGERNLDDLFSHDEQMHLKVVQPNMLFFKEITHYDKRDGRTSYVRTHVVQLFEAVNMR